MFFFSKSRLLIILLGLFSFIMVLPVLGKSPMQPPPTHDLSLIVLFTNDETPTEVTDLARTPVGEGVHTGEAKCKNGHCHKRTQLDLNVGGSPTDFVTFEYQFRDFVTFDNVSSRAIVTGTGKILRHGQPERFAFTATIQDNFDGTVSVTYVASRPDASFIIPSSPGTVEVTGSS